MFLSFIIDYSILPTKLLLAFSSFLFFCSSAIFLIISSWKKYKEDLFSQKIVYKPFSLWFPSPCFVLADQLKTLYLQRRLLFSPGDTGCSPGPLFPACGDFHCMESNPLGWWCRSPAWRKQFPVTIELRPLNYLFAPIQSNLTWDIFRVGFWWTFPLREDKTSSEEDISVTETEPDNSPHSGWQCSRFPGLLWLSAPLLVKQITTKLQIKAQITECKKWAPQLLA